MTCYTIYRDSVSISITQRYIIMTSRVETKLLRLIELLIALKNI